MIGDTASSVGVVIRGVIIYFTGYYIIDPILSIVIAILILVWAISLIRDSVRILMESTPKNIDSGRLKENMISELKISKTCMTCIFGNYNRDVLHDCPYNNQ